MVVRILIVAAIVLSSSRAAADAWPTPAAGDSASGDIEVLFTFDDGPNPTHTPRVLDILKEHQIQAVFFLVGEMVDSEHEKAPAIIQRILDEGHVIANHTMTHQDLCSVDEAQAIKDLDDGRAIIERVTSMQIQWFRAPYGVKCERLDTMLAERGLTHFHWDLDPQEWRHGNAKRVVKYVTGKLARASGRSVLLLHDIKRVTVKALPQILAWIEEENARRATSRQRKIRILQAPELAFERMTPGLAGWFLEATAGVRDLPKTISSVLP